MFHPLKPFIITIVCFFLVDLGITFTPVETLLDREFQNSLTIKHKEIGSFEGKKPDVLFLGSSRVNNGFATAEFEQLTSGKLSAYNLGLPTADYYVLSLILEDYIHKNGKPKLLLVELNDFSFKSTYFNDIDVMYYRNLIVKQPDLAFKIFSSPLLSLKYKKEIALNTLSGIYRYRSMLAPNYLMYIARRGPMQKLGFLKGWSPEKRNDGKINEPIIKRSAKETMGKLLTDYHSTSTSQLEYLLNVAQQQAIPVVLVIYPNHPLYQELFDKSPYKSAFLKCVGSIQEKYQYPVVDLNSDHPTELSSLYFDVRHLSEKGAIYYTKALTSKVIQLLDNKQSKFND